MSIYSSMDIQQAQFEKSVTLNTQKVFFDSRNEVVFVWRSNVGKSSLMNTLMRKKDLVKTSSKPWKTRNANIFLVNNKYYFTDLPWYGFAKLGQELREDLDGLISWYLEEKKHMIRQVVLLCDAKIWPQETDVEMYHYISELELPVTVVLSKTDRLRKNDIIQSVQHTKKIFFWARILPISSHKHQNIDELRKVLWESLKS